VAPGARGQRVLRLGRVRSAQSTRATDFRAFGFVEGKGRTRFSVRLLPERPRSLRRILITATDREGAHPRKVTVPVTR
jgi:hypothetical protein